MANLDLSEIRALLAASAETERRAARKPLLGGLAGLRSLVRPPREAARPSAPSLPPPRRVGLAQGEAEAPLELTGDLVVADPPVRRRHAFGMRTELEAEIRPVASLALPAPAPAPSAEAGGSAQPMPASVAFLEEPDVGAALRRLGSRLTRAPVAEAPYLPEDLADLSDAEADHYFPDADLFDAPAQAVDGETPEEAPVPANDAVPEQELLTHLERVFLAEQAALHTRSA